MKIFLIGFMGAGKSTIGRKLAEILGFEFADLDELVEKNSNLKISEIFEIYGETEFRKLESKVLEDALQRENMVVATGGGTVISEWNRKALKEGDSVVVYLQAETKTVLERLKDDDSRPLLKGDKQVNVKDILSERRHLYEEIADFKILTDGVTPMEIAEKIVSLVVCEGER